jgi:hypothetical protein
MFTEPKGDCGAVQYRQRITIPLRELGLRRSAPKEVAQLERLGIHMLNELSLLKRPCYAGMAKQWGQAAAIKQRNIIAVILGVEQI